MKYLIVIIVTVLLQSCSRPAGSESMDSPYQWKDSFREKLNLYGHRNWILVVDKAFPAQTASGIEVITSGEGLLPTLSYVLSETERATHVKPIVYTDRELSFISPDQVPAIDAYRSGLQNLLTEYEVQTILHDSVFVKIDQASKLFKVLVIKTEEVVPYSSVFLELDCRYWSPEQEKLLKQSMGLN